MNLFAILGAPTRRIVRLALSQQLQSEVAAQFKLQETAFVAGVAEADEHEFDGRYKPDRDEILKISEFDDADGLVAAIENPLRIQVFDSSRDAIEQIQALFSGHSRKGSTVALIQIFERRRILSRSALSIVLANNTFQKIDESGLTIDTKLVATLQEGVLRFKSFHLLRRVFDVDELFDEATDQDIQAFLGCGKIVVPDDAHFLADADSVIRRKIGLILQSGILDRHTAAELQKKARTFGIKLILDPHRRLTLPTERAMLKKTLLFLDEDYFESAISKTKFVSNSKRAAG